MAVDGDPDALAPPVAPSDAEPDPDLPRNARTASGPTLTLTRAKSATRRCLSAHAKPPATASACAPPKNNLASVTPRLAPSRLTIAKWVPRRTPRPARSRWSGHNVSAVLARTQGLCFRVRGALRLSLGSVGRRMGGRPPRGRGHAGSRARPAGRQCIGPGKPGREVVTGTIGARRAWTVSMISALSMPWR